MTNQKISYILFCESPFAGNKVDEDYENEFDAAKSNGFSTLLFNFEDLTSEENSAFATKRINKNDELEKVIYRGWMLTPKQYVILYDQLLTKNFQLINTVTEYQNCHYLPDSLKFITQKTPKTIFEKFDQGNSLETLIEKSKVFGNQSVILKDYVKSEKHDWESACFVKDVSDTKNLESTINNLLRLRGKYLNEGIVIREFLELNDLTIHSKSGMPLTEEYRFFFCCGKLIGLFNYWEEGEYNSKPDTKEFETIAKNIESNFFSMDIARQKSGELVIIELGDGQVAGLPDQVNFDDFYKNLKVCSC